MQSHPGCWKFKYLCPDYWKMQLQVKNLTYHYPIDTFIITPRQREITHPLRSIFSGMYFPRRKKRAMIPYGTLIRDGLADFIENRFVYLG